jgi:hypothetical protein
MTFSAALAMVPYSITSLWPEDVSKVLASSALQIFGLAAAGLIA